MVSDMITLTGENEKVIKSIIDRISVAMMDDMGGLEVEDFRDHGPGDSLGVTVLDIGAFGS
jgi:hypothetical protein